MRDDDRFGDYVSGLIRELDPPPPAPRDAMWAHIEAARRGRRPAGPSPQSTVESMKAAGGASAVPARVRPARARWLRGARWAAPLAAALLVGIGIGVGVRPADPGPGQEPALAGDAGAAAAVDLPYRLVVAEHLDAAEALLSALPHDTRRGDVDVVSDWAEDLLLTTRLLLDSPAAADPRMATLFEDLELVLAQIASISATQAEDEVEMIEDGIRQNNVLLRVRAATMQRVRAGI